MKTTNSTPFHPGGYLRAALAQETERRSLITKYTARHQEGLREEARLAASGEVDDASVVNQLATERARNSMYPYKLKTLGELEDTQAGVISYEADRVRYVVKPA